MRISITLDASNSMFYRAFPSACCLLHFVWILLALILTPNLLQAQSRTPIEVSRLRLGLPAGPLSGAEDQLDGGFESIFKAGVWAPVWVDLAAFDTFNEPLELVVETADADNSLTSMSVPLPAMQKGDRKTGYELGRVPYLKPAAYAAEVSAYVRTAKGRTVSNTVKRSFTTRDPSDFLIVSIGNSLSGYRLKPPNQGGDLNDPDSRRHRGGAIELAQCLEVGNLPDHWIGYSAFDLMILSTGDLDKFWTSLKSYPVKQQAILEWVRRGGRALVSVGYNLDLVNDLPLFKELLPATLPPGGKKAVPSLPLNWFSVKGNLTQSVELRDAAGAGEVFTAEITPRADRPYRRLSPPETNRQDNRTIVVQGTYGLGRVTLVGFDLDRAPFTDWKDRDGFWEWLTTEAGGRLPESRNQVAQVERDDPQFTLLNDMLDNFEGVPVISFGWVALFILIYILLIGPVDYFFLKKVVKRLEWTWVTFPLIVLTVSALAYYAAYAVKGSDQKINKIDFVDVDLQTKRIYGQAYFTIFSPRIQNYSIGLEPAGPQPGDQSNKPTWTSDDTNQSAPNTVLSWNSQTRDQGRSLVQRHYRYHTDYSNPDRPLIANGVEDVPIQVWSTKSFTASYSANMNPNLPLLTHTLHHPPGEPDKLIGTVTSNLPVSVVAEARVFYRDRSESLQLTPGVEKPVTFQDNSEPISTVLGPLLTTEFGTYGNRYHGSRGDFDTYKLYGILFGDRMGGVDRPLAGTAIRQLDQTWRIRENSLDQAILVVRLPTTKGSAEAQSQDPASPSRLWLSELPGTGAERRSISGTLRQATYVRFFIPIPRAEK